MMREWVCIFILGIIVPKFIITATGPKFDEIIERFEYQLAETGNQTGNDSEMKLEFLVIGRSVSWTEAEVLCATYVKRQFNRNILEWDHDDDINGYEDGLNNNSDDAEDAQGNGHLATIDYNNLARWLARKLAESNYRYDGLWIGGHRKSGDDTWKWIGVQENENNYIIPKKSSNADWPPWFEDNRRTNSENSNKNCLAFDKRGHDKPLFVDEDCHLRRAFICQRITRRNTRDLLREGNDVTVNNRRYILYHFPSDEDGDDAQSRRSVKKLNGGGVKWRDALLECHRRGQELAVVPSNEAAEAIADIMLKSRPSMESAWLGGWSAEGSEWTWVSSGESLPFEKSPLTGYPPWFTDHREEIALGGQNAISEYYVKRPKCLVLDRHSCPLHVNPVFIDLDCEKRRPFICQTVRRDIPRTRVANLILEFTINGHFMRFSKTRMTWGEGKTYCEGTGYVMARVSDQKTLDAVLEQMAKLSLNHIWVAGRTRKIDGEWKWSEINEEGGFDSDSQSSWWCSGAENRSWSVAKADLCLNLDREGRDIPLFYGLPCNETKQYVLCAQREPRTRQAIKLSDQSSPPKAPVPPHLLSFTKKVRVAGLTTRRLNDKLNGVAKGIDTELIVDHSDGIDNVYKNQESSENSGTKMSRTSNASISNYRYGPIISTSIGPLDMKETPFNESESLNETENLGGKSNGSTPDPANSSRRFLQYSKNADDGNFSRESASDPALNATRIDIVDTTVRPTDDDVYLTTESPKNLLAPEDHNVTTSGTTSAVIRPTGDGVKVADLDEETKKLLRMNGYDLTNTDVILGLEMELVHLPENESNATEHSLFRGNVEKLEPNENKMVPPEDLGDLRESTNQTLGKLEQEELDLSSNGTERTDENLKNSKVDEVEIKRN